MSPSKAYDMLGLHGKISLWTGWAPSSIRRRAGSRSRRSTSARVGPNVKPFDSMPALTGRAPTNAAALDAPPP
jgi:hypothetical protein